MLKKRFLFLIIIVCLFTVSAASAKEINNEANDLLSIENDNSVVLSESEIFNSDSDGSFTDLANEISNSSNELILNRNYTYNDSQDLDFINGFTIEKDNFVIDGQGYTISGENEASMFNITGNNVVLKNINFIKAFSVNDGGAVYFNGNGTLQSCSFDHVRAVNGGAVYFNGNAIIKDCNFTWNYADQNGGAVYFASDALVENSNLNGNRALCGGAIYAGGNAIVKHSNFILDTAGLDAGAILFNNTGYVDYCNFNTNQAGSESLGGAIVFCDDGIVNNSVFYFNMALGNAGAIEFEKNGTVENTVFTRNHAARSNGAILFRQEGRVKSCNFTNNSADSYAGAICFELRGDVDSCNFDNNTGVSGGAIIFNNVGNINNSNFINNKALWISGGAIYGVNAPLTITNSLFLNNKAKSTLYYTTNFTFRFMGSENILHALQVQKCNFSNVTYWNGSIVNSDDVMPSLYAFPGINVTVEIYDSNNSLVDNVTLITNADNLVYYNPSNLIAGNYTFKAYHADDSYYYASYVSEGSFSLKDAKIDVDPIYLDLLVGDSDKLYPVTDPEGLKVRFISSDDSVVAVDDEGNVLAVGEGNATITASVGGDGVYGINSTEVYVACKSPKKDLNVSVSADPITFGEKAIVVISGLANATGNITVTFMDEDYSSPITGNIMNFVIPFLFENTAVVVSYPGDENYNNFTESADIIVNRADSNITVILSDDFEGNPYHVNIKLPGDSSGNVTVILNGNAQTIDMDDAEIFPMDGFFIMMVTYENLTVGSYNVTAIYHGNKYFNPSNDSAQFIISPKENVTMDISASPVDEGENITIDIKFPYDAVDAYVVAVVDGKNFTVQIDYPDVTMTLPALPAGNYTIPVIYSGNYKYYPLAEDVNVSVKSKSDIINAPDITKYYNGPERFVVTVTDCEGNPLANKTVTIGINGVSYSRTTDANGNTSIALGLNSGVYDANVTVDNKTVNSVVTILTTVNGTDIIKVFRNATQYYATFRDSQGNYLKEGQAVRFNINGVMYDRKVSGDKGLAKLNINLNAGEYVITAMNMVTGERAANNITVLSRFTENKNLTKYYRNASQYTVKVLGDDGKAVGAGETVRFNINGVIYERTTNASGIAKLNINLQPGDYIITAEYKGCVVSNNIKVLYVLNATDITMKYRDGTKFEANLVDGQGKPFTNQTLTFNINGVMYSRVTDGSGIARLNINLMPGEYIITSMYSNGAAISNKVTIRS